MALIITVISAVSPSAAADKFQQLEGIDWPTPDIIRRASGAPGEGYWQQKVDYRISATLDEEGRRISGVAEIVYHNRSPDTLTALWLLLDQNIHRPDSAAERSRASLPGDPVSAYDVRRIAKLAEWSGGFQDVHAETISGHPLTQTINGTLMRIDLPKALAPGARAEFRIRWKLDLAETHAFGARSGYECFAPKGDVNNCIFLAGYWFPRLAAYSHEAGWGHKQFLGAGEYALEFGDYDVSITAPLDHIVAATGELVNADKVLTKVQRARLRQARTATAPIYIVTPEEAAAAEPRVVLESKTWRFKARNVRDFGFASSRKFIWDAMGVQQQDAANPLVMAMSFYPEEARPLWNVYSTRAIAHTLDVFGKLAFPYPYPVVQSVNGPAIGIEHPMISFTGIRPTRSLTGEITYSKRAKEALIGTVIHEVGHNWFPMIVNSDERQWGWLDEGIVTFLQMQAERLWDKEFPSERTHPREIAAGMRLPGQKPIMTATDDLPSVRFGAYTKPAAALILLRQTILGETAFDEAFKTFAERWRFKRATPYDFFRTMEDLSGVDLDWFWRGWFYSTDYIDIAIENVSRSRPKLNADASGGQAEVVNSPRHVSQDSTPTLVERHGDLRDFYNEAGKSTSRGNGSQAARIESHAADQRDIDRLPNLYSLVLANRGGLVSPIPLRLTFENGASEIVRIPAEIWRRYPDRVVWRYATARHLKSVEVDPFIEIGDADRSNNVFDRMIEDADLPVTPIPVLDDAMRDACFFVSADSIVPIAENKSSRCTAN